MPLQVLHPVQSQVPSIQAVPDSRRVARQYEIEYKSGKEHSRSTPQHALHPELLKAVPQVQFSYLKDRGLQQNDLQ